MSMSESFKKRLFPILPKILEEFGSPAHIYDETGIVETINLMKKHFFTKRKGKNFFAVKACPNMEILRIMLANGCGLDCSSPAELVRARRIGAKPEDIMFTSNNTTRKTFEVAMSADGCIINIDDATFIGKLMHMPQEICFRYNPGELRGEGANEIIGFPPDQKYGMRYDEILGAYQIARDEGAKIFGIHTMYASNQLDYHVHVGTVKMLLDVMQNIQDKLGIKFEFLNMGGGLGIPYRPEDIALDIKAMGIEVNALLDGFEKRNGYCPKFFTESGRFVTGPHGILVGKCVNRMEKYKKFIGVDFCDLADIPRAVIYKTTYHGIIVLGKENSKETEIVDVVGPLCENFKLAKDRKLSRISEGDTMIFEDTGAHGIAMSSNYNGWTKSQELLFRPDDSVIRIARPQSIADLLITETDCDFREYPRKRRGK